MEDDLTRAAGVPRPRPADVDARFLLANERTVLAWLRTSVALVAGGVGIHEFGDSIDGNSVIGIVLILLGAAAAVLGAARYIRADEAIRRGGLPPGGRGPLLLVAAVALVSVALAISVIVQVLA